METKNRNNQVHKKGISPARLYFHLSKACCQSGKKMQLVAKICLS